VRLPYRGIAQGSPDLVALGAQWVKIQGRQVQLPPQFLPKKVHERYLEMMSAMERRIGKRLLVESGYRSSAYQLYLFLFYLKNHDYSIRETVKWVALPGYSEHGAPEHQAIDFINSDGISGETDPAAFENLEEYRWLLENAGRFGFVLSYPKARPGVTFEPWHWRCETRYNPANDETLR
jgi:D-alanyl-D-alanine carboxypeptidase